MEPPLAGGDDRDPDVQWSVLGEAVRMDRERVRERIDAAPGPQEEEPAERPQEDDGQGREYRQGERGRDAGEPDREARLVDDRADAEADTANSRVIPWSV